MFVIQGGIYEVGKYNKNVQGSASRQYNINKNRNIFSCIWKRLTKVLTKLEEMNINYIVLDKADNYSEMEKEEFKNKNQYNQIFNKAHKYITKKNRIDAIYNYLIDNISSEDMKEKLTKVEEIVYGK